MTTPRNSNRSNTTSSDSNSAPNDTPGDDATPQSLWQNPKTVNAAFRIAPLGMGIIRDREFFYVNEKFCTMLGYSPDELIHQDARIIYQDNEEYERVGREKYRSMNQFGTGAIKTRFRHKNGTILNVILTSCYIAPENPKDGVVFTAQEVTPNGITLAERNRLAAVIEQMAEYVIITNTQGDIEYVNPTFERVTGYTKNEVIGKNPRFLKSGKHSPMFYQNLWQTIRRGEVWSGRIINKIKDGTLIEEESTISPFFNESGNHLGYICVKRDITEQVKLEEQFRQSQKMEAIGTLAGGIAHDFNNILAAIIGFTELAVGNMNKNEDTYRYLQQTLKASKRAKDLVQQILTFSRHENIEKKPIDAERTVKECVAFLRSTLPSNIEIKQNIGHTSGYLYADITQINQILMNLSTNAAHSMDRAGGTLEIGLCTVDVTPDAARIHSGLEPGPHFKLTVKDTGHGMPPEILKKIFDPYFTTKVKGDGTGLGLAVVHGIVNSYNGVTSVKSAPGQGTEFTIYLPSVKSRIDKVKEFSNGSLPGGHEKILFVDDEPQLVSLNQKRLENLGYQVEAQTSSTKALEIFAADPYGFDLVITDMTMPTLMGDQLASAILKIRPDIPIILCTGYNKYISEELSGEIGIKSILMKPLTYRELAKTIRKFLDKT